MNIKYTPLNTIKDYNIYHNFNDIIEYNGLQKTSEEWRKELHYTQKEWDTRFRKYSKLETIIKPNLNILKEGTSRITTIQLIRELYDVIKDYKPIRYKYETAI